ncbi:flagellar hook-basal body complex protein FliE [Fictibacillus aquaticus]|uniref:Flagellar hook-basal body complex protein FliE n=1 Tax=Fictibacillus aquaticus TaxID=2021314 RepID=A0A235FC55_9BACL|nr:flagellar hook-basal body complex protein FliE [Fictibacillus aquaticus]OYD58861.1 flagellar hook-basal body complex protein FliE [Fictibacillus aquaticus]
MIQSVQSLQSAAASPRSITPNEAQQSFKEALYEAINTVNDAQIQSNKATEALMTGKTDNLHQVMIAAEKASITLQTAVEIRNKAVEAYQEMMRMQI